MSGIEQRIADILHREIPGAGIAAEAIAGVIVAELGLTAEQEYCYERWSTNWERVI